MVPIVSAERGKSSGSPPRSVGSPEELRQELSLGMNTEFLVNGDKVVPHCTGA